MKQSKSHFSAIFVLLLSLVNLDCRAQNNATVPPDPMIFPRGQPAPASNFTGKVWLHHLNPGETTFDVSMGSVTFEAGARSNWHRHPAGQILVVISGTGYHQERGKQVQMIKKGDVVRCLPNTEHWHGASRDSAMTHIAVNPNTTKGVVTWMEPVTDEVYQNIPK
jgi:quercetin dioxygenase-like cupin family protein